MTNTIFFNGRITTLDPSSPTATAVALKDGLFEAVGDDREIMTRRGPKAVVIDLKGRTVIPGLNDSHTHLIRGGLNYNLELRWNGVPSLADALRMLREQARRTPAPQWVRVVGGWSEFQFVERRMPTLAEINAAAPDTPVFVLHLYARAMLNAAALRAVGYTKDTPEPLGGKIERDTHGNSTGMLTAKPNAMILYATLGKGPKLPFDYQLNSTRYFMRELNRLGITSVCSWVLLLPEPTTCRSRRRSLRSPRSWPGRSPEAASARAPDIIAAASWRLQLISRSRSSALHSSYRR